MSVESLRIEKADNGFIIGYCLKTRNVSNKEDVFSNYSYEEKKEVFDVDSKDEKEDMDEFMSRLKELIKSM